MGYSSDLRDKDCALIKDYFATGRYGNRAVHSRLSLVNGILYVVKIGCQWRFVCGQKGVPVAFFCPRIFHHARGLFNPNVGSLREA